MNLHDMQLQAACVRGADGEFHLRAKASQEKKLLTHYDILVSKTPEEMALWMHNAEEQAAYIGSAESVESWLDWLMTPVEDQNNDN